MTAREFVDLAQKALILFKHKPGCESEPEIVTKPVTGQIAMVCRQCHNGIVITKLESADAEPMKQVVMPSLELGDLDKPKPRFLIP